MRSTRQLLIVISCAFAVTFACKPRERPLERSNPKLTFHLDWSPGPDYIGFYVADELGYYDDAGIDIEILPGNGAEEAAQLIAAGKIQLGTTTVDALLRRALRQLARAPAASPVQDARIVAIIFERNPVILVTPEARPIQTPKDLAHLKIGFSEETSVTYGQFTALLASHPDIDPAPEMVRVGWNGPQELRQGSVDAILAYLTDVPPELKSEGFGFRIKRLSDFGLELAGQCVAMSPSNSVAPATLTGFLQASVRGWEFARANPKQAAELFAARYAEQDREKTLSGVQYTVQLLPEPSGLDMYAAYTSHERIAAAVRGAVPIAARMMGTRPTDEDADSIVASLAPKDN